MFGHPANTGRSSDPPGFRIGAERASERTDVQLANGSSIASAYVLTRPVPETFSRFGSWRSSAIQTLIDGKRRLAGRRCLLASLDDLAPAQARSTSSIYQAPGLSGNADIVCSEGSDTLFLRPG